MNNISKISEMCKRKNKVKNVVVATYYLSMIVIYSNIVYTLSIS